MKRFAIHAHVYYPELWDELEGCVRNFPPGEYDLFVTTPHGDAAIGKRVLTAFPECDYRVLENRGYDVGPFIDFVNRLNLSDYEYLVKLHTKRDFNGIENYIRFSGAKWREWLLAFCKTKENLSATLRRFRDPTVGMVGHPSLKIATGDFFESKKVIENAAQWVAKLGLRPKRRCFVGGTMFIVKAELFRCLQGKISIEDFAEIKSHEAGTLAHVFERVLGYVVYAQGYRISGYCFRFNFLALFAPIIVPTYRILAFVRNQMPDRRRQRRRMTIN